MLRRSALRVVPVAVCACTALALGAPAAQAQPTVVTGSATGITSTSATVNGTIATGGQATQYTFQYGTSTAYGQQSAAQTIPAGRQGVVAVSAALGGLPPNTTFHYRLVAASATGNAYYPVAFGAGSDATFQTSPAGLPTQRDFITGSSRLRQRNGIVTVRIGCVSPAGNPCKGLATITIRSRVRIRGKLRRVTIRAARQTFSVPAGTTRSVRLRLTTGVLRTLSRSHKLQGRLTLFNSNASPQGVGRNVTLLR